MKDSIKKPNFFIIGAPKCGTTSLYHYLKEHPNIFLSEIKEPDYFATDLNRSIKDREEYMKLFEGADNYKAIGEASTTYLYSDEAIENILEFNPEAKFIVMTRDPVEMFHSLHSQNLNNLNEIIKDPQQAWGLQEERKAGKHIPSTCRNPLFLQYGEVCSLGKYVKRLHQKVSDESKIRMIRLENFKDKTKEEYEKVLRFLGIESDGRERFPVYGSSSELKVEGLKKASIALSKVSRIKKLSIFLKKKFNLTYWPFMKWLNEWNQKKTNREPLGKDFKAELEDYFQEDKKLLSELIRKYEWQQ